MAEIIFVTGTDTGVGKTVLTTFMLWGMRRLGLKALAMKPLCSGGREDAELLNRFQGQELPLDVMNPYYFELPASPLIAARREGIRVSMESVAHSIERVAMHCDWLLIEGAGGLLSPLGEGFTIMDLLVRWKSKVMVAGKNRLGIMNHVLLTDSVLRQNGILDAGYWLLDGTSKGVENEIKRTNLELLGEILGGSRVFSMPDMGKNPCKIEVFKKHEKYFQKTVARFLGVGRVSSVERRRSAAKRKSNG